MHFLGSASHLHPDMMTIVSQEWLADRRDYCYRRTPARRVHTVDEARAFVDEVGFCHFWPIQGIELPNLFHAIAGCVRPVPLEHDDPDGSRCWGWKDDSLGQHWWYYGKLLRRRATLVSLAMLPYFWVCSPITDDLYDYLEEYRAGTLTFEAKQIYEALLEQGPLDTLRLRRAARLSAESATARFERALVELQVGLKVLPVGIAEVGAWRYAFVYEIVQRHFPDLPERARGITPVQARQTLVARYLDNVVAETRQMIGRVFHVFNWPPAELERTIAALRQQGLVQEIAVRGVAQPCLASVRALAEGVS